MITRTRRRVIAGNWKMCKTQADTRAFFSEFLPLVADTTDCDIVIAPPFTSIAAPVEVTRGSHVAIGGQNDYGQVRGAFTGVGTAGLHAQADRLNVIDARSELRDFPGHDVRA